MLYRPGWEVILAWLRDYIGLVETILDWLKISLIERVFIENSYWPDWESILAWLRVYWPGWVSILAWLRVYIGLVESPYILAWLRVHTGMFDLIGFGVDDSGFVLTPLCPYGWANRSESMRACITLTYVTHYDCVLMEERTGVRAWEHVSPWLMSPTMIPQGQLGSSNLASSSLSVLSWVLNRLTRWMVDRSPCYMGWWPDL